MVVVYIYGEGSVTDEALYDGLDIVRCAYFLNLVYESFMPCPVKRLRYVNENCYCVVFLLK